MLKIDNRAETAKTNKEISNLKLRKNRLKLKGKTSIIHNTFVQKAPQIQVLKTGKRLELKQFTR